MLLACIFSRNYRLVLSCGWLHDEKGMNQNNCWGVELGWVGSTAWGFIRLWLLPPWALAQTTTAGWRSCPRLAQQIILTAPATVAASIPKAVVTMATTASTAIMTTRSESVRARRRALKGWEWREWLKWMPVPWAPCLILHMGLWDHWCHPLDWHLIPCHQLHSLCLKLIWHLQALQVFKPARGMSLAWHHRRTIFRWMLPVLSPACPLHLQHGRIMWVAWRKRIVTFVVCWCNAWALLPPFLPAWFPVIDFMPWKAYSHRHQQGYQARNMPIESIRQLCHLVPFLFVHRGGMPPAISRLDVARFFELIALPGRESLHEALHGHERAIWYEALTTSYKGKDSLHESTWPMFVAGGTLKMSESQRNLTEERCMTRPASLVVPYKGPRLPCF